MFRRQVWTDHRQPTQIILDTSQEQSQAARRQPFQMALYSLEDAGRDRSATEGRHGRLLFPPLSHHVLEDLLPNGHLHPAHLDSHKCHRWQEQKCH